MIIDIVKVILPAVLAFWVGIAFTPFWTNFLYRNQMWKKQAGKLALGGQAATVFNNLHRERETKVPRLGGVVVWFSAFLTVIGIWLAAQLSQNGLMIKLDFLSRNQTWIPLFTLITGSLIGLLDDYLEIAGNDRAGFFSNGLSLKKRLLAVAAIGLLIGGWFFFKLEVSGINLPGGNFLELSWLFVPFFSLVTIAVYSGGVIDGLDGLAGGIFAIIFSAYAVIAFNLGQINLAAFSAMLVGATLAFLWFNIPPARFYLSETGTMGLTLTLSVVAFMTDKLGGGYGIAVLPIIAFPLVAVSLSNIIQLFSKKLRGKKIFLVAPIHHHFEAKGWPAYKVTMRFWIIGVIFAMIGVIIAFL